MIFVTVGTHSIFDRLILAVDNWAANHPEEEMFAQIGASSTYPQNMPYQAFLKHDEVTEIIQKSRLIVSHAGMGTVFTGLKYKKPLLLMPRKASLGEHLNEHQLASAKWLENVAGIKIAWDEEELLYHLDHSNNLSASSEFSDFASAELITNLKNFFAQ